MGAAARFRFKGSGKHVSSPCKAKPPSWPRAIAPQVERMEQEDQIKTEWARKASAELEAKCQELAHCVGLLDIAEATVRERTVWAQNAEAARANLAAQLRDGSRITLG